MKKYFKQLLINLRKEEIIVDLIILIIGIFIFIESTRLLNIGEYYDSPGLLPTFLAASIIFISIILLWEKIKRSPKVTIKGDDLKDENIEKEPLFNWRIGIIIIIIVLYVIALSYTSFLIASVFFLFILIWALKAGNLYIIGIISVIAPIVIQYIFQDIFKQLIP